MAESDISTYIDDTTLYVCQNKLFDVQSKLRLESTNIFH